MEKKNYQQPATTVVSVTTETLIAQSVRSLSSNSAGISYGGKSSNNPGGASARVKDAGEVYDVWDDDWSE